MISRTSLTRRSDLSSTVLTSIAAPTFSSRPQYLQQAPEKFDENGKKIPLRPYSHLIGGESSESASSSVVTMTQSELLRAAKQMSYVPPHPPPTPSLADSRSPIQTYQINPRETSKTPLSLTSSSSASLIAGQPEGNVTAVGHGEDTDDASDSLFDLLGEEPSKASSHLSLLGAQQSPSSFPRGTPGAKEIDGSTKGCGGRHLIPKVARGRVVGAHNMSGAVDVDVDAGTTEESMSIAPSSESHSRADVVVRSPKDEGATGSMASTDASSDVMEKRGFTSNSQFVQQLLGGFLKGDAAAKTRHTEEMASWSKERKKITKSIREGSYSYPLSDSSKEWAKVLAAEKIEETRKEAEESEKEKAREVSPSGLSAAGGGRVYPYGYDRLPQVRSMKPPMSWHQHALSRPSTTSLESQFSPMREREATKRGTTTTQLAEKEEDDDLVVDPVHDAQLLSVAADPTLSPQITTSSQHSLSFLEKDTHEEKAAVGTTKAMHSKVVGNFKSTMNPIRDAARVSPSKIGPDIIDLVSEEFAEIKKKEIERRQRILYELTHPIPTDYTFNGKLVPPPPLSFGKVTEEAVKLGETMMTKQPYRLVRQAKSTDYFFELNDLYMEIVMVGRANAGKSSLINGLLDQPVAKTSSLPNSTRTVNFYQSATPEEIKRFIGRNPSKLVKLPAGGLQLTFVDLPGFGITGMSDKWRDNAIQATDSYLGVRRSVNTVFMCIDAVKGVTHIDKRYLSWIENLHGTFYIVLTKCDAVSHQRLCSVMREIYQMITDRRSQTRNLKSYKSVFPYVIPVSAKTGHNMDLLRGLIVETSGMINGGKLREMLKRKMEERNMLAEKEELLRIAEARALEKEIAAEEYRLLHDGNSESQRLALGDGLTPSGDASASPDEERVDGSEEKKLPSSTSRAIQLNPEVINRVLGQTKTRGVLSDVLGNNTSANGGIDNHQSDSTQPKGTNGAMRFNLGLKASVPMMLKYNAETGEIEETPMDSRSIRSAAAVAQGSSGIRTDLPAPSTAAAVFAGGLTGSDLDDIANVGSALNGEQSSHMTPPLGDIVPSPTNTTAVIGLGTDREAFAAQINSSTASQPRALDGSVIHSHKGAVSKYLEKLESFERAEAERRKGAGKDATASPLSSSQDGATDGGLAAVEEPAEWWKVKAEKKKSKELSRARFFVEESPERSRLSPKQIAKASTTQGLMRGVVPNMAWVEVGKGEEQVTGASKFALGHRGKTRQRIAKALRADHKPPTAKDKRGGREGGAAGGDASSSVASVLGVDRSVVRPYYGQKPLQEPAVIVADSRSTLGGVKKGGVGDAARGTMATVDPSVTRAVLLAKEAMQRSPSAPWRGLEGAGAASSVVGMDTHAKDNINNNNNNANGGRGGQHEKKSLSSLAEATKELWATDDSIAELAKFHAEEEEAERLRADRFGVDFGGGGGGGSQPDGPFSVMAGRKSTRQNAPRNSALGSTEHEERQRSFLGSDENRSQIKRIMEARGPLHESLGSMKRRLEKEHNIEMSKKELDWYRKTAGKTIRDYDVFHGETKMKHHLNATFVAKDIHTKSKVDIGRESRISFSSQAPGMMRKYGRKKSYWRTPRVVGNPEV